MTKELIITPQLKEIESDPNEHIWHGYCLACISSDIDIMEDPKEIDKDERGFYKDVTLEHHEYSGLYYKAQAFLELLIDLAKGKEIKLMEYEHYLQ